MKTAFRISASFIALALLLAVPACVKKGGGTKPADVDYYTCAMHPSVKSQKPDDKCPICSMDLVPVTKKGGGESQGGGKKEGGGEKKDMGDMKGMKGMEGMGEKKGGEEKPSEFVVPAERQQQIGVTYAKVERKRLQHTIRSVGVTAPDRGRNWQFVSRVDGYVQKLHVTSPGEIVEKDAPLLSIYSPDLLTSEREFVELLRMRDEAPSRASRETPEHLIAAAKERLRLWNVTDDQIADLEKTRKPQEKLTLLSPFRGVVQSVPVEQGKSVKMGDMLVEVADLSVVWVWADFYENELSMLQKGQKVTITAKSYPGQKFQGEISLINPFLEEMKRTAKVRIDIPNPDFKLRPQMYVNIELGMDMGEALTVPVSAVMPTGTRNIVFVDKGEGKLEPRIIQLGAKYGDIYEVNEGLAEAERVVASANFLIDAESKVQQAIKTFEEVEPESPEMKKAMAAAKPAPLPDEARAFFGSLIETYLALQKRLAHDKFDDVPDQAAQLRKDIEAIERAKTEPTEQTDLYHGRVRELADAAQKFKPANLDEARVQFGNLSAALIALLAQFPPPLEKPLHVMKCPMWQQSPAQWVQVTKQVENPFMGQAMLTCGELVKTMETGKQ